VEGPRVARARAWVRVGSTPAALALRACAPEGRARQWAQVGPVLCPAAPMPRTGRRPAVARQLEASAAPAVARVAVVEAGRANADQLHGVTRPGA